MVTEMEAHFALLPCINGRCLSRTSVLGADMILKCFILKFVEVMVWGYQLSIIRMPLKKKKG